MLFYKKKIQLLYCVGFLLADSGLNAAVITDQSAVTVNFGTGENVSYLVFDESSLNAAPIIYAWHYDGLINATTGMGWTGADMMNAVAAESSTTPWTLSYTAGDYGFITSVTIGSNTSMVVDPYGSPLWTYWIKGGNLDAYNYDTQENFTISPLDWVVAPSASDSRWISPGSYDGWTISPFNYTGNAADIINFTDTNGTNQAIVMGVYSGGAPLSGVSAVPEPSTLPLLIVSGGALFLFFRWKSAKKS